VGTICNTETYYCGLNGKKSVRDSSSSELIITKVVGDRPSLDRNHPGSQDENRNKPAQSRG